MYAEGEGDNPNRPFRARSKTMTTGEDIFQWLSRMTEDERKAARGMLFDRQWLKDGAEFHLEDKAADEACKRIDALPCDRLGEVLDEVVDGEFDGEDESRAQYNALERIGAVKEA